MTLLALLPGISPLTGGPAHIALGLVPPLVMLALAALIAAKRQTDASSALRRESLLLAAMLAGIWVMLGTELLSLFRAISFWPILAWWLLPALPLTFLLLKNAGQLRSILMPRTRPPLLASIPIALTAVLLLIAGIVAALSPPTIVDSTIYHMPRQILWMQQHHIGHYPTPVFMQLAMPPLAEYASLHLMLLSGTDVYTSPIQWLALVLCALAASLIARHLGGGILAQSMAALLVVSNPMAWIQGTNVKNDLISALWVLILAAWFVKVMRDDRCTPRRWLIIGAAAALATATKLTGIIFSLPLLAALALWLVISRARWRDWPFRGRMVVAPLAGTVLAITLSMQSRDLRQDPRLERDHAQGARPYQRDAHTRRVGQRHRPQHRPARRHTIAGPHQEHRARGPPLPSAHRPRY